jgi:hypothetical protein
MRNIYVKGIHLESIKDDEKMTQMFEEIDDKVFRIAEKKFLAICKKFEKDASISVVIQFNEEDK